MLTTHPIESLDAPGVVRFMMSTRMYQHPRRSRRGPTRGGGRMRAAAKQGGNRAWRSLGAFALIALAAWAWTARSHADVRREPGHQLQAIDAGLRDSQEMVGLLQAVLGPLPAVAMSPSLTLATVTGVGLLCEASEEQPDVHRWVGGVCGAPMLAHARAHSSVTLFVLLAAFALACYLANIGKIAGIVGKGLKVVEAVPTLLTYFVFVLTVLVPSAAGEPGFASLDMVTPMLAVALALAAATALAAMMLVRFAIDVLVWLSPFPFVDAVSEQQEFLRCACSGCSCGTPGLPRCWPAASSAVVALASAGRCACSGSTCAPSTGR